VGIEPFETIFQGHRSQSEPLCWGTWLDAGLSGVGADGRRDPRPHWASRIGNGKQHTSQCRFRCGLSNNPSITRLFAAV